METRIYIISKILNFSHFFYCVSSYWGGWYERNHSSIEILSVTVIFVKIRKGLMILFLKYVQSLRALVTHNIRSLSFIKDDEKEY